MRIPWRNLRRNRWRSGLTAGGVAIAVASIIWMAHMMDAFMAEMIHGATRAELGDFQIHSAQYVDEKNLFHTFSDSTIDLELLRRREDLAAVTPRVHAWGLLGHEVTSQSARLMGVDPQHEALVTTTSQSLVDGDWFSSERPRGTTQVVLGRILAERLRVGVGDTLVVMLQAADGSLGNDSLEVIGLVETKNAAIDRYTAFIRIGDLQWMAALDGRIHEIAGVVKGRSALPTTMSALRDRYGTDADELVFRSWKELVPELANMSELSRRSMWIFYGIIYFVAGLGLFNTQRMTAFERRREFGVLLAIGTLPGRLMRQVLVEAGLLTILGGLLGVCLGLSAAFWHSKYGMPLGDGGFSYMGVAFSDRLFFELDWKRALVPFSCIVIVGWLCALWPAVAATRLNIPSAISGRL